MSKKSDYSGPKYSVHGPEKHEAKGIPSNFFIKIESGPYDGVEYCYTTIQNKGVDEEDRYHLSFGYVVLYSPPRLPRVVQRDFEAVLWDILCVILEEMAEAIAADTTSVEIAVVDELDRTVPDEFHPEEFLPVQGYQQPETD